MKKTEILKLALIIFSILLILNSFNSLLNLFVQNHLLNDLYKVFTNCQSGPMIIFTIFEYLILLIAGVLILFKFNSVSKLLIKEYEPSKLNDNYKAIIILKLSIRIIGIYIAISSLINIIEHLSGVSVTSSEEGLKNIYALYLMYVLCFLTGLALISFSRIKPALKSN